MNSFFCQNLLSDYIERVLPPDRQNEMKQFLESDQECQRLHEDVKKSLQILSSLPLNAVPNELELHIIEASENRKAMRSPKKIFGQVVLFGAIPLLFLAALVGIYPTSAPLISSWFSQGDAVRYVRYYPLFHGAAEILERQVEVFETQEAFSRSFWEEGGLSPTEFEKAFGPVGSGNLEKSVVKD